MTTNETQSQIDDAQIALSHLIDDYEKVRTGAVRDLRVALDLLLDARDARAEGLTVAADEFDDRARALLTTRIAALVAARA